VAFDQHVGSVMAAILMPGDRTPALLCLLKTSYTLLPLNLPATGDRLSGR
jgi:hypothetical protein